MPACFFLGLTLSTSSKYRKEADLTYSRRVTHRIVWFTQNYLYRKLPARHAEAVPLRLRGRVCGRVLGVLLGVLPGVLFGVLPGVLLGVLLVHRPPPCLRHPSLQEALLAPPPSDRRERTGLAPPSRRLRAARCRAQDSPDEVRQGERGRHCTRRRDVRKAALLDAVRGWGDLYTCEPGAQVRQILFTHSPHPQP